MDARFTQLKSWLIISSLIWLLGLPSEVHGQSKGSAMPPEVQRTVDAFLGHWVLTGTDTEPSPQVPVHFNLTIACKPAALGAAVSCSFVGRLPGVGRVEAASVIGYSPDEQVVRWMEISSTGEYHDHRGQWKGDVIEFEPLEYSVSGKKATEYLSIGFPSAGNLTLRSVTETGEGKSILECMGKRLKLKSK
jgi:hypothetical protein